MPENDVSTPSADHDAMSSYWRMASDIMGGIETMRAGGECYLPRHPGECDEDFRYRVQTSKLTNIFRDIVETLASKPFTKEVALIDGNASEAIAALAEDIDAQGSNLHRFAASLFFDGVKDAVGWLFVDYTGNIPANATVAQERQLGARPYWVAIKAADMLDVKSAAVDGREQFIHARWRECSSERKGWGERFVERIRVIERAPIIVAGVVTGYEPATWQLWELVESQSTKLKEWQIVDGGPLSIGIIPLVPFVTGRRMGASWRIAPPMRDAAELQVELYQQESALKSIQSLVCFPMLSGNGIAPDKDAGGNAKPLRIGPKAVVYAPPDSSGNAGEWKFIEPAATSLRVLMDSIAETQQQLRELGRQPLTAQSGNLTVITTSFAATKANSVLSAWALNLKDALELAFAYTALWLRDASRPEVFVHSDINAGLPDEKGADTLLAMRKNNDVSQRTLWEELKRRDILAPEFTAEREEERLLEEAPSDPTDEEIDGTNVTPFRAA